MHQTQEQNRLMIENIQLKLDNLILKVSAGKLEV